MCTGKTCNCGQLFPRDEPGTTVQHRSCLSTLQEELLTRFAYSLEAHRAAQCIGDALQALLQLFSRLFQLAPRRRGLHGPTPVFSAIIRGELSKWTHTDGQKKGGSDGRDENLAFLGVSLAVVGPGPLHFSVSLETKSPNPWPCGSGASAVP